MDINDQILIDIQDHHTPINYIIFEKCVPMLRQRMALFAESWILFIACLMCRATYCTNSWQVSNNQASCVQRAGDGAEKADRLASLLSDLVKKDGTSNFIRSLVVKYKRQLHADKICKNDSDSNGTANRYRISDGDNTVVLGRDDTVSPLSLLFADDGSHLRPKICKKRQPLQRVLEILNAALILVDPFTDTPEMGQFRANSFELLSTADSSSFGDVRRPEDIPGCTMASLRAILDLYTGMDDWVMSVPGREYSAAHQDGVLNVYQSASAASSTALSVLLHLVRLCGITELNMRGCRIVEPIDAAAVDILAQCKITRLAPPLDIQSCKHLHLTADGDTAIQDRIWNGVSQVSMFSSRRDILQAHEVDGVFASPTATFCRGLAREAVRPSDFAVLEHLEICGIFPACQLEYLEQAVNLQVLKIEGCQNMPELKFLKMMPNLQVLVLRNVGLTVLPGDILVCLTNLIKLCVSDYQLSELPDAFGYLKELRILQAGGNLQLRTIPDSVTECRNLTELILPNCKLESLPDKLGFLENLKHLDISGNQNSELLSAVSKCTSLQHLAAAGNRIRKLPSEICNLVNLRILDLRLNKLIKLPSRINNMPALEVLHLSDNRLFSLPPTMVDLSNLHSLYLERNRFKRVSRFVVNLRKEGSLFRVMLTGNNLRMSDSGDQMGHRTLWAIFGTFFLSRDDHLRSLYKNAKERVYGDNRWVRTYWNMKKLKQPRRVVPPCGTLSEDALGRLWSEILSDERLLQIVEAISSDRLLCFIDMLYNPQPCQLRKQPITDADMAIMRGYFEAISLNLYDRLGSGELKNAQAILCHLDGLLVDHLDGLIISLRRLYSLYCLSQEPGCFPTFVGEFIARQKENALRNMSLVPESLQDAHIRSFFRRHFSDELGLSADCAEPSSTPSGDASCPYNPADLLRAFFKEFDPKTVAKELADEINSTDRARPAFLYLAKNTMMPDRFIRKHFDMDGGSNPPVHGPPIRIKVSGARMILRTMGYLQRNYLSAFEHALCTTHGNMFGWLGMIACCIVCPCYILDTHCHELNTAQHAMRTMNGLALLSDDGPTVRSNRYR